MNLKNIAKQYYDHAAVELSTKIRDGVLRPSQIREQFPNH